MFHVKLHSPAHCPDVVIKNRTGARSAIGVRPHSTSDQTTRFQKMRRREASVRHGEPRHIRRGPLRTNICHSCTGGLGRHLFSTANSSTCNILQYPIDKVGLEARKVWEISGAYESNERIKLGSTGNDHAPLQDRQKLSTTTTRRSYAYRSIAGTWRLPGGEHTQRGASPQCFT